MIALGAANHTLSNLLTWDATGNGAIVDLAVRSTLPMAYILTNQALFLVDPRMYYPSRGEFLLLLALQ